MNKKYLTIAGILAVLIGAGYLVYDNLDTNIPALGKTQEANITEFYVRDFIDSNIVFNTVKNNIIRPTEVGDNILELKSSTTYSTTSFDPGTWNVPSTPPLNFSELDIREPEVGKYFDSSTNNIKEDDSFNIKDPEFLEREPDLQLLKSSKPSEKQEIPPVPEPMSAILVGSGLIAIWVGKRKVSTKK